MPSVAKNDGLGWRSHLAWAFAATTAVALISFSTYYTSSRIDGRGDPAGPLLLNEFTGAYTVLLLLPGIYWLVQRWPLHRHTWVARLPGYLLANGVFGGLHTTLMIVTRKVGYPLLGFGEYSPKNLGYQYLMELSKQLIIFWLIVAAYAVIAHVRQSQAQKLALARTETQLTEARLAALSRQLNPHFLFNTLNMISSVMYENLETADRMITHLSELLRLSLRSEARQKVALDDELRHLRPYLALLAARFGDRLTITEEIAPDARAAAVPVLCLQPLVENAIKHGMDSVGATRMTIVLRAAVADRRLIVAVEDDGAGATGDIVEGTGLRSTRERLATLYGDTARIVLEPRHPAGFRVQIELPFERITNAGPEPTDART